MIGYLCKYFYYSKTLGGHAKMTSPLLKIIKYHAIGKHRIHVEKFVVKYKTIIGNHYFDIMAEFQYTQFRKTLGGHANNFSVVEVSQIKYGM